MPSKASHRRKLLDYLSDPDNDYLTRAKLATQVLGYKNEKSLHRLFSSAELHEIEREALEIRRTRYSPMISKIDRAVVISAITGDMSAAKLAYQRFEGWSEKIKKELTGANGAPLYPPEITVKLVEPKQIEYLDDDDEDVIDVE